VVWARFEEVGLWVWFDAYFVEEHVVVGVEECLVGEEYAVGGMACSVETSLAHSAVEVSCYVAAGQVRVVAADVGLSDDVVLAYAPAYARAYAQMRYYPNAPVVVVYCVVVEVLV
jgi:hypothetical protein